MSDHAPPFPDDVTTSYHDGVLGRMRSGRSACSARVPEFGWAVADC
jgi:hypothetical protein